MNRLIAILTTAVVLLMSGGSAVAQLKNIGTVVFPTSGSPEAQKYFMRGAAILHSFGWKQAIEQFHKAQELDPDFAMAYWGEALCYNHPLQNEGNLEEPRQVLKRLGATPEARLAKAPTDREKGFLRAVEAKFFNEGDAAQRKFAYRDAMQQLYEAYPNDHEVASYYALSLLSAASRMGDQRHRVEVLAGSIAMKIFAENPNHPGGAHYTIHSFDDPVHAPMALPAAWKFATIAAAVSHARHMPSHIFIQRGIWEEVSKSNQSAYDAAVDLWESGDSVGDMVHALGWGQYGDLQRGDYEKARAWISLLEEILDKRVNPDQRLRMSRALAGVKARYIVETEQWKTNPVTEKSPASELLATGISAVKLGNISLAEQAEARLAKLAEKEQGEDRSPGTIQIMHGEVAALVHLAKGNKAKAVKLLEVGVKMAEGMPPPRGPANAVKPVHEFFGEVLLDMGQSERSITLFEKSLLRMPNRPRSLLGLARAYAKIGDKASARAHYEKLLEVWVGRSMPDLKDAKRYIEASTDE